MKLVLLAVISAIPLCGCTSLEVMAPRDFAVTPYTEMPSKTVVAYDITFRNRSWLPATTWASWVRAPDIPPAG